MALVKVGVFDSGIGGLSILGELMRHPSSSEIEFDYIADDAFSPYGGLSEEEVLDRARLLTQRLMSRGIDLVVVACHTATALAISRLRGEFPELIFVGVEPYLNIISHRPDLLSSREKIGVLTTVATGKSQRFKDLKHRLDPDQHIFHASSPKLAGLVEDLFYDENLNSWRNEVEEELSLLKDHGIKKIILGCTHYSLIEDILREDFQIEPIGPCRFVAKRVFDLLTEKLLDWRPQEKEEEVDSTPRTYWFESTLRDLRVRRVLTHKNWQESLQKDIFKLFKGDLICLKEE